MNKPQKRIAFIHPFLYRYARGIERYVAALSRSLSEKNVSVEILTWNRPNPICWPELSELSDIKIKAFPLPRYFEAKFIVPFYALDLAVNRYDDVIIHFADYGEAEALYLLKLIGRKIPYSIVLHYPYSQVPHRYHSFNKTLLAQGAKRIIAVSRFVAEEAEKILGRPCEVISHGVDTDLFKPDLSKRAEVRRRMGVPENARVFLTAAALEERKGVQHFIKTLPLLLKSRPESFYAVLGDGPYLQSLKDLACERGVESRVRFVSATSTPFEFYQAADLFVILAKGEASSLVSLEAMACEVPVMASKQRPFEELIDPRWGIQVREDQPQEIVSQIDALFSNSENFEKMRKAARIEVLKNYQWGHVAESYLQVLSGEVKK